MNQPNWWLDHEFHKLCDNAQSALFKISQYMEKTLDQEDWREIFGMRLIIKQKEAQAAFQLGYKDGRKINEDIDDSTSSSDDRV